jgi:serine/threonine protein kinase/tetratricopeptide (TPR) repeat protein
VIGQTLGHYILEEKLGEGGMGVVYRARDTHLDRLVAIKVLRPDTLANPERKRRFIQEAKSASALNHPNIITVYDISNDGGIDYIAMEYVAGQSLDRLLGLNGLPLAAALQYSAQVADALAAAHEAGIVHRDLKPGNLVVSDKGRVKLLDFGLAKLTERGDSGESAATETFGPQTEEGAILGTVVYMSPEQAQGAKVDGRSDIFSFGAMLYEMVTGRRPFSRRTPVETLAAILRDEPPPTGAGAELDRVIARCLAKHPAERFQSAHDLAFALRSMQQSGTGSATPPAAPPLSRRPSRGPRVAAAAAALLLVLAAGAWWFVAHRSQPIESLAVLPFVTAGGDPDTEYLSEGLSESLITSLSRVPRLKVKSRDTVFRYQGRDKDAQQVGRDLGVRAVLRGRLVHRGGGLSISAELVDTSDGNVLWRDQYNRKTADLLAIQQEISNEISRQLRLRLTGEDQRRLAAASTRNPEAFQLYLQGRYWWNRRTDDAVKKAVEYFQQAIERDPGYAQAWAGLADSYVALTIVGSMPAAESYPKAKAAANRAIELDEALAEPRVSRAMLKTLEWDWPGAERDFRRALELNPDYGTAHHWFALHLVAVGRLPEALAEIRRAQEVEPLSPIINAHVGWCYYFNRQYEPAVAELRKTVEMDPSFGPSHEFLGAAYALQRRPQDAAAEFEQALKLSRRALLVLAYSGSSFAFLGRRAEALKVLQEMLDLSRQTYVGPSRLAMLYASLGERDHAFEYYEKGLEDRSILPWFLRDPLLDPIRSDPRFQSMMQRMGLAP